MKRAHRILLWGGTGLGALIGVTLLGWAYLGRSGTSDLERWLGQQIIGIVNSHVNPTVSFDDLDYRAPRTVVVQNLRLHTAEHEILKVERLLLELADVPRRGRPIQIQQVRLDQPHVQLLTTAEGGLLGWGDFVKADVLEDPNSPPPGLRLSDVLVLRNVAIHDGEVVYNDAPGSGEPMRLSGIELELDTPPAADEPGWYALVGTFERSPVFSAAINGRINLDTGVLELGEFRLRAALEEEQYAALPPTVQRFLQQYAVRGRLAAAFNGTIPLDAPELTRGLATLELSGADFRRNAVEFSLGGLQANLRLPDGLLRAELTALAVRSEGVEPFATRSVKAQVQLPTEGQAFAVRELSIAAPRIVLAQDERGEYRGWRKLVGPTSAPATAPAGTAGDRPDPLRELLQALDWFEIADGAIVHQGRGAVEPHTLERVNLQFAGGAAATTQPAAAGVGRALRATLSVGTQVTAALSGWLDPSAPILVLAEADVRGSIGSATYALFPPAVADWLAAHEVRGDLRITGAGRLPLDTPSAGDLRVTAEVADAQFTWSEVQVPITAARLEAHLPRGAVTLTAGPLALRTGTQEFFALERLRVELAGVPSRDQPLVVERLELQQPHARFLLSADGGLAGWPALALAEALPDPGAPSPRPAATAAPGPLPIIRALRVTDAAVTYAAPEAEPVTLDGIEAALATEPGDDGTQSVTARVSRAPLLDVELVGALDAQHARLAVERLRIAADAGSSATRALPAAARDWLDAHEVAGRLTMRAEGTVPLRDWRAAAGQLEVALHDAQFAANAVQVPLAEARLVATLPEGPVQVTARQVRVHDPVSGGLLRVEGAAVEFSGGLADLVSDPRLRLRSIQLDRPRFRLAYAADGDLRGWSRLLGNERAPAGDVQTAQRAPAVPPTTLLPELLELQDAEIEVVPAPGAEPVVLSGIDVRLALGAAEAHVQPVQGRITRGEDLEFTVAGRLDQRRNTLAVEKSELRMALSAEQLGVIPGIGALLDVERSSGTLLASFAGAVPLDAPQRATGEVIVDLRDARIEAAPGTFPAERVQARLQLPAGPLELSAHNAGWEQAGRPLLTLPRLQLEAANVPWAAEPFEVRSVRLESPRVVLAAAPEAAPTPTRPPAPAGNGATDFGMDRFRLGLLEIADGQFTYGPAAGTPLTVDGITARVQMPPAEQPGWYQLQVSVQRAPVLDIAITGQVHPDRGVLDLARVDVRAGLRAEQHAELPAGLREFAREHDLHGEVRVRGRLRLPWAQPAQATGKLLLTVEDGRFARETTVLPIKQARVDAELADGQLQARYSLELLSGSLGGTASVGIAAPQPLEVAWEVRGVQLAEMLRAVQQQRPAYSGRLASQGQVRGELSRLPESLTGGGTVQVSDGQLLALPIINDIARLVSGRSLGLDLDRRDTGEAEFALQGTHSEITSAVVQSPLLEMRGRGQIYYDGKLDLRVNAGLFERLQSRFGPIGKIVGEVTDRTVLYRVDGTLDNPRVNVSPLGF